MKLRGYIISINGPNFRCVSFIAKFSERNTKNGEDISDFTQRGNGGIQAHKSTKELRV